MRVRVGVSGESVGLRGRRSEGLTRMLHGLRVKGEGWKVRVRVGLQ